MTLSTVLVTAVAVLLMLVAALGVMSWLLSKHIAALRIDAAALEQQLAALRDQHQRDLLVLGQHVMDADKLVGRFSARLDAIENNHASAPQYGQLAELLTKAIGDEGEASTAELELLSLLRRQQPQ